MGMNERTLIEKIPTFLQGYAEIKAIMATEQTEIEREWEAVDAALDDQFLSSAGEYGVKRWETMLNIVPALSATLDERRFKVQALLNAVIPYTMNSLRELLDTMCGVGGYSIDLVANEYKITIKLALQNKSNYNDVDTLLRKIIPCNMVISVEIKYNNGDLLSKYTHNQLAAYTHEQLRSEVLSIGN